MDFASLRLPRLRPLACTMAQPGQAGGRSGRSPQGEATIRRDLRLPRRLMPPRNDGELRHCESSMRMLGGEAKQSHPPMFAIASPSPCCSR